MTNWEEMTEAQKDEANDAAWAMAADRLRSMMARRPDLSEVEARRAAFGELQNDILEELRIIGEARKARASSMAKRFAANSAQRVQDYSLAQGFILDVDVDV